jgi:hypothetical protein
MSVQLRARVSGVSCVQAAVVSLHIQAWLAVLSLSRTQGQEWAAQTLVLLCSIADSWTV